MKKLQKNKPDMFCPEFDDNGFFISIDRHFAGFMEKFKGGKNPEVKLAAALLSRYQLQGHICIDSRDFWDK